MTFDTWARLARRQMRFKQLLTSRLKETDRAVAGCTDLHELLAITRLCDRVERHQRRMDRHDQRRAKAAGVDLKTIGGVQ
jgi:hypothetical protein